LTVITPIVTCGRAGVASCAPRLSGRDYASVLIFWLLGFFPIVLLLTWVVTFYLTFIEARQQKLDAIRTLWWMLLVFLVNFIGYLALRAYVFYQRRATT
jgi:hypothetical protein